MKFALITALPLASAAALPALAPRQNYFSFGNSFSTGAVATNSFIRQSTTTLVLPKLQSPHTGNLGLWPGMGTKFLNSNQDGQLVQGLAISTVGGGYVWDVLNNDELVADSDSSPCNFGANDVKWCITASTYDGQQTDGKVVAADPGDHVTYDYKYNDSTKKIDQTVSVNGKVVSTLSTTSGVGAGWGTAMECQQNKCGTVPEHHYLNTTLIMDVADPNYSRTLGLNGASGSLITKDKGKTWTVADIKINQYTYV